MKQVSVLPYQTRAFSKLKKLGVNLKIALSMSCWDNFSLPESSIYFQSYNFYKEVNYITNLKNQKRKKINQQKKYLPFPQLLKQINKLQKNLSKKLTRKLSTHFCKNTFFLLLNHVPYKNYNNH